MIKRTAISGTAGPRFAVWCVTALLGSEAAGQAGTAEEISWRAAQPLVWSDFRGVVDPKAPRETVATTASALSWTYDYELQRSDDACVYRITDVHAEALFDRQRSWVKPGHRTAAVLEHEQGHFDLTQVHKLMFDRAAPDLIGSARNCGRRRASRSRVEAEVAELVQPLRDEIWRNLQRVQAQYDAETRHGILEDMQRAWTERIQAALRREQWQ